MNDIVENDMKDGVKGETEQYYDQEYVEYSEQVSMNDFKVVKKVGEGTYGNVYLVVHKVTKKLLALKSLKKETIERMRQIDRTKNERRLLEEVRHEFIVALHYCFVSKQFVSFVMDYCPGGELFFHIAGTKNKGLNEDVTMFYISQVVIVIGFLHSKNIIYRDLKPENVLINSDGYIKLADFGYCKFNINDDNYTKSICGTPEYYAPELLDKKGHGRGVDWWTVGCLAYEIFFGKPCFSNKDKRMLEEAIRAADFRFRSKDCSEDFKQFIRNLLTVEVASRLGSNGEDEVREHQWLRRVNFEKVLKKAYRPPFVPQLKDYQDTSYFDLSYMNSLSKKSVEEDEEISNEKQDIYKDYYFNIDEKEQQMTE